MKEVGSNLGGALIILMALTGCITWIVWINDLLNIVIK